MMNIPSWIKRQREGGKRVINGQLTELKVARMKRRIQHLGKNDLDRLEENLRLDMKAKE